MAICDNWGEPFEVGSEGIYDDGDFVCWNCLNRQIEESDRKRESPDTPDK